MRFVTFAVIAAIAMASPHAGATSPADALVAALPRVWSGPFAWRGSRAAQLYSITFTCVEKRDDGKVEATGPAEVQSGNVDKIEVRAIIDPSTRAVEMFERLTPEAGPATDGLHRGALSPDLATMNLVWTMNRSGRKGDLRLSAGRGGRDQVGGLGAAPCRAPGA